MKAYAEEFATSTITTSRKVATYYSATDRVYFEGLLNDRPTVSVVIPTLNESSNLPLILPFLPMEWIDEVILVDGRSTDNTVEVALQLMPSIKVVMEKRKGKGVAMRAGYAASTSDIIVLLDADGSNDPREIPSFIERLMQGADMVKGSRFSVGGGTTDMTMIRKLGNGFLAFVANILFSQKYTDLCYGFHAFWRNNLKFLELERYDGFEIDTGLYLQAIRKNLRVVEEPSFEGERFFGSSNLNAVRDGIRVLKTIFIERFTRYKQIERPVGFRGKNYNTQPSDKQAKPLVQVTPGFSDPLYMLNLLAFWKSNPSSLLENLLRTTLISLSASNGTLVLLDDEGNPREGCFVSDSNGTSSMTYDDVLKNGLAGWVVKNRQPAIVSDTSEDPRWLQREYGDHKYSKSALSIPLIIGSHVLGVLTFTRPQEKQFTEIDLVNVQRATAGI